MKCSQIVNCVLSVIVGDQIITSSLFYVQLYIPYLKSESKCMISWSAYVVGRCNFGMIRCLMIQIPKVGPGYTHLENIEARGRNRWYGKSVQKIMVRLKFSASGRQFLLVKLSLNSWPTSRLGSIHEFLGFKLMGNSCLNLIWGDSIHCTSLVELTPIQIHEFSLYKPIQQLIHSLHFPLISSCCTTTLYDIAFSWNW